MSAKARVPIHMVNAELTLAAPMNWRKFYSSIDNFIQPSAVGLRLAMMNKLCIFSDAAAKSAALRRKLDGIFDLTFLDIDNIHATESQPRVLFDIDLRDGPHLLELKEWLNRRPKDGKVVFITTRLPMPRPSRRGHLVQPTSYIVHSMPGHWFRIS